MSITNSFQTVLDKFRRISFSERDKGDRFEKLIQAYLQTDPLYAYKFKHVWLWNEFSSKKDLGGNDTGIDLVALTHEGDYWAIQCKCYQENAVIGKPSVDSFLATSSRHFLNEELKTTGFSNRLWISTTNHWGTNAEEAIRNQNPPVSRLSLTDLIDAAIDWEKIENGIFGEKARDPKKKLFEHQQIALENAHKHFKENTRGKLIMACGTGKTFTSLKIAENETNGKGLILFLVPSIALLGQALKEWIEQAAEPINAICICSDAGVSKKQNKNKDSDGFSTVDLALPASTDVRKIVKQFMDIKRLDESGMTVVFSTYQSIDVIAKAQLALLDSQETENPWGIFDLIICDEAHRTTGVTIAESDESAFVKVHDNSIIQGLKRMYMTATPRIYDDTSKSKAAQNDAILCSMDDTKLFGEEIYRIGFGEAVDKDLLSDYKVLVLTLTENDIPVALQNAIKDDNSEINTDDISKLIGCINALSKQILGDEGIIKESDPEPMRRAVAFCANIKDSKKITNVFNETGTIYAESLTLEKSEGLVYLVSDHIDGTMSAPTRDQKLSWLKAIPEDSKECRVLTNARCLSEGVDVPSLDAVLFLSARNSQVDVVQSVGRVMRKAKGKKYGYIIIPVVVPSNEEADVALDKNDRYKVVWTVLNALRAHDDRFNAMINKIELNKKKTDGGVIIGRPDNGISTEKQNDKESKEFAIQLAIQFEQLQSAVFARMVLKVGDRRYWEQWAQDVAKIAERYIDKITNLVNQDGKHKKVFSEFLKGLQKNINPSITQQEAIEMLSQHIITKPVFEALFEGYSFVKNNPISISMQTMIDLLEAQSLDKDAEVLDKFYESVKMRASGIDNAEGKQRIIIELYDKFFKTAFPKMVEKLGIVYTPVECVDFIIHSVNDILQLEFGRSISDENIHLLDPFTGTGTFITRLFQSGLIQEKDLERKYKNEIHANEIVLLAYYIATVNIENAYHDATLDPDDGIGKEKYTPFDGICLTDTFQLGESQASEKLFSDMFPQNSDRVEKQKKAPLRIIFGNPPYSIGQKSANDNAQNQSYPKLDAKIASTYAAASSAGLNKSLYDAYIKAFRWSSDRLDKTGGIISFVSNGAWLDGNSTDGFRKCLEKEFTSIYIFNLRGNQRTSGELSRKEGGKIFGSGSRTPIAITLLIKNPDSKNKTAKIFYHDIGDYLSQKEKLAIIKSFHSINNEKMNLVELTPNEHGDWLSQRNDIFGTYLQIEPDKKYDGNSKSFFIAQSLGLCTNRDAWCYNSSKNEIAKNLLSSIEFYNSQRIQYYIEKQKNVSIKFDDFISYNSSKLNWTDTVKRDAEKGVEYFYDEKRIVYGLYRPFFFQNVYFSNDLNHRVYQLPKLFPNSKFDNVVICVTGSGASKPFSTLISKVIPNLDTLEKAQCFPLYYYEERKIEQKSLFDTDEDGDSKYIRRDGISNFIFERAQKQYGKKVTKEDIFYYVYGFLHSPEYREMFANDLKKMLPRLPLLEDVRDFWAFSKAGRKLADLHINYEKVPSFDGVSVKGSESGFFKVETMRFPKKGQKDTIIFNSKITIENIPTQAFEYVVNGKSAIEWIMERYAVTTHKESQIKNDPNDWAEEVGNPRYILDLLLSIINVSVQTVEIVNGLPKVKFE